MDIELPLPPSANRYWRHTCKNGHVVTYVSAEAKAYRTEVWAAWPHDTEPYAGNVSVTMHFYMTRIGDLDNRIKVLLDALQGLAYEDDKQVCHLEATRQKGKPARVMVHIVPSCGL